LADPLAIYAENGEDGSINGPGNGGTPTASPAASGFKGGYLGDAATSTHAAGGAAIITNGNTITITAGNNSEQVRGAII
jgi:hypothetical protein